MVLTLAREFYRLITEPGYEPSTFTLGAAMALSLSVAWGLMWFALVWLMPDLPQAL